ncbi:MAG TPA: FAD-dependent oxidoreductase [Candidatus Dormibacteraeota bacterium]|nr:FAD-dependent oxidoreductase [Candidatus Dormibacteraeota bacterium]
MITVLGGGVAGAAVARALARRGRRDVVVFDPAPRGLGSTGKAFGGFRTQQGSPINIALSLASRPFFEARADRVGFRPVGYLYLATSPAGAEELRRRAAFQRAQGLPIEHPDPGGLVPFVVSRGVLATNYCRLDGVYRPLDVLSCLVEEATAAGAEFRYGMGAGPRDLEAEAVVICAGVWSGEVGRRLGVRLEVRPVERGIFRVGPFEWLKPGTPVTLELDTGYHFREREGWLLVTGPGDPRAWEHHREWLDRFVPPAAVEQPESHWTGYYEVTFDHHPLVGPTRRPGVWACCGFSGHGVMHAPAAAESLAAMILGESPPLDVSCLDPQRTVALVDTTQL